MTNSLQQMGVLRSIKGFLVPHSNPVASTEPTHWERHPVSLSFDKSPSTFANHAGREIAQGGKDLLWQVKAEPALSDLLEFSVWGFDHDVPARCFADFAPAASFEMPTLPDTSCTWIYELYAESLAHLLDSMNSREQLEDVDIRAAWSFYFSDFLATNYDSHHEALRMKAQASERGVNIFIVGCGNSCDERVMAELAQSERPPILMRSVKDWRFFFDWLFKSLRKKSKSVPGARIELEEFGGRRLIADG